MCRGKYCGRWERKGEEHWDRHTGKDGGIKRPHMRCNKVEWNEREVAIYRPAPVFGIITNYDIIKSVANKDTDSVSAVKHTKAVDC